jgi:hypothetical protein
MIHQATDASVFLTACSSIAVTCITQTDRDALLSEGVGGEGGRANCRDCRTSVPDQTRFTVTVTRRTGFSAAQAGISRISCDS